MRKHLSYWLGFFVIASTVMMGSFCTESEQQETDRLLYRNHSDSATYVGINTCKQCHVQVHSTFQHTGMGQSFGEAGTSKSAAKLDEHSVLYDSLLDFYYHPYWKDDSLYIMEFRLEGTDTSYKRTEKVDYIIGSGQHTNSHIFNTNGYLHQMPFTYYTQDGRLDFPPGFENGNNSRFSRKIGLECMSCHNAYPEFVLGSENKYKKVPLGIDCERCHGPGSLHVKDKLAGKLVDTSKYVDRSIVNVGKLPLDLQFEVCQRCHLQGNAVLQEGKSFFDFRPGMYLKEVMDVYTPRFSDSDDRFIMASHVDRLKSSACYINSNQQLNCISCHNPHISITKTDLSTFNIACNSCHSYQEQGCSGIHGMDLETADCISCHMPKSGSTDIPHVRVTDHKIQIPSETKEELSDKERSFINLYCINNANPSLRSRAKAYLQQYEKFNNDLPQLLDSAFVFIRQMKTRKENVIDLEVYYYYLKNDSETLIENVEAYGTEKLLNELKGFDYDNVDAWVAYRIGQAYHNLEQLNEATVFYKEAVDLAPLGLDFNYKLGVVKAQSGKLEEAKMIFENILREDPYQYETISNLGFIALQSGKPAQASELYDRALALNPDYIQALLNKAGLLLQEGNIKNAEAVLERILKIAPEHQQARYILQQLHDEAF